MIEAFESGGPMVPDGGADDVQAAVENLRSSWATLDEIFFGAGEAGWTEVAPAELLGTGLDGMGAPPARDDGISGALSSFAALTADQPGILGGAGGHLPASAGGDAIGRPASLGGPEIGVAGLVAGGSGVAGGGGALPTGHASVPAALSPWFHAGAAAPGTAEVAAGQITAPDLAGMVAGFVSQGGSSGLASSAVPAAVGDAQGWPDLSPSLIRDDTVSNFMTTALSVAPVLNSRLAGQAPGSSAGTDPHVGSGFAGDAAGPLQSFVELAGAMAQPVPYDGTGMAAAVPVTPVPQSPPADMVLLWSAPVPERGLPGGISNAVGPPPDREWDGGGQARRHRGGEPSGQPAAADGQSGEAAPIVVHTEVHLDGAVLARAVTDRIVLGMNGPLSGTGGFDARRSYTPVEG